MDTNEIQTLRREVDTLRNENIALYNELVKQNKILCEELIALRKELFDRTELLHTAIRYFNSQDLRVHLVHAAGIQTAEFIARNMNTTVSLGDKKNYLRNVLNHIENFLGRYLELVAERNFEFEYIARTDKEQVAVKIK